MQILLAQSESDTTIIDKPDTTYIDFRNKTIIIIEKSTKQISEENLKKDGKPRNKRKFESKLAGFDMGINNYMDSKKSFTLSDENHYLELEDSRSYEFNLNFGDVAFPIISDKVAIVSAIGIKWNNYRFDNKQFVLQNDQQSLYYDTISAIDYKKNKLTTTFLTIPLGLEIHIPSMDNVVWLYLGGYAEVKLGSYTKLIADNNDKKKTKEDFHLNTIRYGLRAQMGIDDFSIYGSYSAASLFKKSEGPELYPITVGISISF